MSNLDRLISDIISEGDAEAGKVLREAQLEAERVGEALLGAARAERERLLAGVSASVAQGVSQLISAEKMRARDEFLASCERVMDFFISGAATERLEAMSAPEFVDFVVESIEKTGAKAGLKISVAEKYSGCLAQIREKLAALGYPPLEETGGAGPKNGFVLTVGATEYNFSLENFLEYHRGALEAEISRFLREKCREPLERWRALDE